LKEGAVDITPVMLNLEVVEEEMDMVEQAVVT
jgi:hypothetical protein